MSPGARPGAEPAVRAAVPDAGTLASRLAEQDYLADEGLATALFFALGLPQPLLLEGEAGVGKTEAAKALAAALDTPLIRVQCYEGIDAAEVLYEWNYPRQLLRIRMAEATGGELAEDELFGDDYLVRRPLLAAIEHPGPLPAVLLIDELDRADDDFEAFLLQLLAEASLTIPELGTIHARHPPIVVLTSNRTRDLHDALKRRCLYHWIDYPGAEREAEIVRRRVPAAAPELAADVAAAVRRLRTDDLQKQPGIAEAIDWVAALELLGVRRLDAAAADRTLAAVLKYREDQELVRERGLAQLVAERWLSSRRRRGGAPARRAFGRALHGAGLPGSPERSVRFARALQLGAAGHADAALLDRAHGLRLGARPGPRLRRRVRGGLRRRPRSRRRARRPGGAEPRRRRARGGTPPHGAPRLDAPPRDGGRPTAAPSGARDEDAPRARGPRARGQRAGAPGPEGLRRARARRAARAATAHARPRGRHADAPGPARAAGPPGGAPRRARDAAGQPPDRRRPRAAGATTPGAAAAAARRAVRHLGLDGALRAGLPAVPARRGRRGRRGGLRLRDAADAPDPRAAGPPAGPRARARGRHRAGLVGRHADRRGAARASTTATGGPAWRAGRSS